MNESFQGRLRAGTSIVIFAVFVTTVFFAICSMVPEVRPQAPPLPPPRARGLSPGRAVGRHWQQVAGDIHELGCPTGRELMQIEAYHFSFRTFSFALR